MKGITGAVLFVAFLAILQAEEYTSKWDNIDIDEILRSDRLLGNYKNCLMDKGRCTPDAKELKRNLPDALKTECSKCTAKQKVNTEKVINYMIEHKKDWWEELQAKYDPTGIYYGRYLARKNSEGKPAEGEEKPGEEEKKVEEGEEKKEVEERVEKKEKDGEQKEEQEKEKKP